MKRTTLSIGAALKWLGKKIAEKLLDAVWLSVGAIAVVSGLVGWLSGYGAKVVNWFSAPSQLPRWTLAGAFVVGVLATGSMAILLIWRSRRDFAPMVVRDQLLPVHWRIKVDPRDWIDDDRMHLHGHQYHESVLAGPFHATGECGDMLKCERPGYSALADRGPLLMTHCPGCDAIVFKILEEDSYPLIYDVRLQAIEEIRRLARLGRRVKTGMALEQPQYWKSMLPHPTK